MSCESQSYSRTNNEFKEEKDKMFREKYVKEIGFGNHITN